MAGSKTDAGARAAWKSAVARVRREPWFAAGGWTISAMGEAGLQLSKRNWFNDDGNGIHFEAWTTAEDLDDGAIPFQAHVMHVGQTFPGTKTKASALSGPVLARCGDTVRSWGYRLPRAPGMTLLSTRVPLSGLSDLPNVVARECGRFATIAPVIDEVLACLFDGRKPPRVKREAKAKATATPAAWGDSVLPPFEGVSNARPGWSTFTEERGEIGVSAERDGALRVTIGPKSRHGYHAVLRCSGLSLAQGRSYRVAFDARAETPHRIAGNIRQTHKPFLVVGFFPGLTIPSEWQTFTWDFVAERDEADATIAFALGKEPKTLWLRNLSLQPAVGD